MSVAPVPEGEVTLEEALDRLVNLGERDPLAVKEKLAHQYGERWLIQQALPYLDDWLAEVFRRKLGAARRADLVKITTKQLNESEALKLRTMWVPDVDGLPSYIRVADATPEDFDRRAAYLERQALHVLRHAAWCREVALRMRAEGLGTAGELREFPPLPELGDLELPELGE